MSQEKLREKLMHVRGELRRARARIKELEGELALVNTRPYSPGFYKAMADTCSTQADRAGQTQAEVFKARGTR